MVIVIRAGGSGTRLWPVSRRRQPKQFHALLTSQTLLQDAFDLYRPLVRNPRDLFVSVAHPFVGLTQRLLPKLPKQNIIAEPISRNTGPGIGLESVVLRSRYSKSDPVVASVTCDDVFTRGKVFHTALRRAETLLKKRPGAIVTIGNRVTQSDPGLSYLKVGRPLASGPDVVFRPVQKWIEKPSGSSLSRLAADPHVFAHTGLYLWRLSTILNLFRDFHPQLWPHFDSIGQAWGTRGQARVLKREYTRLPSASVESMIARFAPQIIAGCGDFGWSDTGKWFLLRDIRAGREGNVTRGRVVTLNTERSLLYAAPKRVLAAIGLKDVIVVDTPDALLVTTREASAQVKDLLDELERQGFRQYS